MHFYTPLSILKLLVAVILTSAILDHSVRASPFNDSSVSFHSTPRIANGSPADPKDFSFVTFIDIQASSDGSQGPRRCAGAVIGSTWVLTSSQCLANILKKPSDYYKIQVYAGDASITGGDGKGRGVKTVYFIQFITMATETNLIVLQVDKEFDMNRVKPIKITQTPIYLNTTAVLAGFGSAKKGGPLPTVLNYGNVIIESEQECKNIADYRKIVYTNRNSGALICTRNPKGTTTGCDFDDGSLLLFKENSEYTLGGIFTTRAKNETDADCAATNTWEFFTSAKYNVNRIAVATKMDKSQFIAPVGSLPGVQDKGVEATPPEAAFISLSADESSGPNKGLIIGVSVGGAVLVLVITGLVYYLRRQSRKFKTEVAVKQAETQFATAALAEATDAVVQMQMQHFYEMQPVIAPVDAMSTSVTSGGTLPGSVTTAVDPTTGQIYAAQLDPATGRYYAISAPLVPHEMQSMGTQLGRFSNDDHRSHYEPADGLTFLSDSTTYGYTWPREFLTATSAASTTTTEGTATAATAPSETATVVTFDGEKKR